MNKKIIIFFIFLQLSFVFAQHIEKIGTIQSIKYIPGIAGGPDSPNELSINEIDNIIKIINKNSDYTYYNLDTMNGIKKDYYRNSFAETQIELGDLDISFSDTILIIEKNNKIIQYIAGNNKKKSGICFLLKKDDGYIVYYLDNDGKPAAADTNGRIYTSKEAIDYLRIFDSEKYEQSLKLSKDLELYNDFISNRILIWGNIFYKKYNTKQQYDIQGYRYFYDDYGNLCSVLGCYFNDKCIFYIDDLNPYSEIKMNNKLNYLLNWYVGFGGNIYYYIAGEEYTEVFRIRRTWGEPDFYAMAINGYTEDDYGKYVNEVLPKLNKADLRLLRNTIFALYGVHFKSADLSKYFDKQVWYTDEGKTSADVTLPEHRQKLVEMIQKLEK